MRPTEDDIRRFNDSLDQCVATPRFLDIERFVAGSDDVATRFAGVDMTRQKRALKASLYTATLAAGGNSPAIEHLHRLSDQHLDLRIEPEHYDLWLDCLIASARECGGMDDARTAIAWRSVLQVATDIMKGETRLENT